MSAQATFLSDWETDRVKVDGQEHFAVTAPIYGDVSGPVLDTMNCHHCLSIEDQEKVAKLAAAAPALFDGCNVLLGLIQLIECRNDLTPELRKVLRTNHRREEALAAVAKVSP